MQIEQLFLYPLKSCAGIEVHDLLLTPYGPQYDREFVIVDAATHLVVTQREQPRLALVSSTISEKTLTLRAPGMGVAAVSLEPPGGVTHQCMLFGETCYGTEQSLEASNLLSEFLGSKYVLLRYNERAPRTRSAGAAWRRRIPLRYVDAEPLLVLSSASLGDLNSRLGEPVGMERFRPNIVIGGCVPYAEDAWRYFRSGGVQCTNVAQCIRCSIPTIDPRTGTMPLRQSFTHLEPIRTLRTYRMVAAGIAFGSNFRHRSTGLLRQGEPVLARGE